MRHSVLMEKKIEELFRNRADELHERVFSGKNDAATLKLIAGYKQFLGKYFTGLDGLFEILAKGQSPSHMIIACSDSRVDPDTVFQTSPGEIFVLRLVAALVPEYDKAKKNLYSSAGTAIEYAVKYLGIKSIIVKGHSGCGGINAALNSDKVKDSVFIKDFITLAEPAKRAALAKAGHKTPAELEDCCQKEAALLSAERISSYPFISEKIKSGEISVEAMHKDIETGIVTIYDRKNKVFAPLISKEEFIEATSAKSDMRPYAEFDVLDGTGNSAKIVNFDHLKAKIIRGGIFIKARIVKAEEIKMCTIIADELHLEKPPFAYAKLDVKKILVNGELWQKPEASKRSSIDRQ